MATRSLEMGANAGDTHRAARREFMSPLRERLAARRLARREAEEARIAEDKADDARVYKVYTLTGRQIGNISVWAGLATFWAGIATLPPYLAEALGPGEGLAGYMDGLIVAASLAGSVYLGLNMLLRRNKPDSGMQPDEIAWGE